jgi:hypothetical protein
MPKKQSKVDSGMARHNAWMREQKKLEKMGLHGTDYYVKRVDELEAKVKKLEAKLKAKGKK